MLCEQLQESDSRLKVTDGPDSDDDEESDSSDDDILWTTSSAIMKAGTRTGPSSPLLDVLCDLMLYLLLTHFSGVLDTGAHIGAEKNSAQTADTDYPAKSAPPLSPSSVPLHSSSPTRKSSIPDPLPFDSLYTTM